MSNICTCIFSFPIVDTKICSVFSPWCLSGGEVKQGATLSSASIRAPDLCLSSPRGCRFHEWAGNNRGWLHSHLFAEIYKRRHSYTCEAWSQGDLYICFSSPYLLLMRFHVEGKKQAKLFFKIGNVTYCCSTSSAHCLEDKHLNGCAHISFYTLKCRRKVPAGVNKII